VRWLTQGNTLVMVQAALSCMLLVSGGLFLRSMAFAHNTSPGFDRAGVQLFSVDLSLQGYDEQRGRLFYRNIIERLKTLPGVESVSLAFPLPMDAYDEGVSVLVEGYIPRSQNEDDSAGLSRVGPRYFETMGTQLVAGRGIDERDTESSRRVAVINETMARRYWPGRDPVGLKFVTGPWGPNPSYSTIIGVAGDVKQFGLDSEPTMDLYFPNLLAAELVVRTAGRPDVRRAVQEAAPEIPIAEVRTMDDVLRDSARTRRWTMALLGLFAGVALLLALVGIYGVMAWSVAQRRREIGIRIALGAGRRQVLAMVLRKGLTLSAIGMAAGAGGALALRRVLTGLVFGVSPSDPLVYGAVGASMLAVAIAACYLPARRASTVDPLVALRCD